MPSTPYARIDVRRNGGPVEQGGVVAAAGDVVRLAGENTTGWGPRRWEIYGAPPGWVAPAGWTFDAAGDTTTRPATFYSTAIAPPAFTLSDWGTWTLELFIGAATTRGGYQPNGSDRAFLRVPSARGVTVPGLDEFLEYDRRDGWNAGLRDAIRTLDTLIAAVTGGGGLPVDAAGGDLALFFPNPQVVGLRGRPLAATAPAVGQGYVWDGALLSPGVPAAQLEWDASCAAGDAALGDLVALLGEAAGAPVVGRADPGDATRMPAVGVVIALPTATACRVRQLGLYATAGLAAGQPCFVGVAGALTQTRPHGTGGAPVFVQHMGFALTAALLSLQPSQLMTRVSS
jgi:hypothetical protein